MVATESDQSPWNDAVLAAALFALDPVAMSGIVVTSRSGPVRDLWFETLTGFLAEGTKTRRIPGNTDVARLVGGLDLAATLRAGRPVADRGLLAEADGGIIVLPSVERAERQTIAHISAALDRGRIAIERDGFRLVSPARFGVVAFDEGIGDDEVPASALTDRLAFHVRLEAMSVRDAHIAPELAIAVAAARGHIHAVAISDVYFERLCAVSAALGIGSMRPALHAVTVARATAALHGRTAVADEDAEIAVRLVLGPKARQIPAMPPQDQPQQSQAEQDNVDDASVQQSDPPPPEEKSQDMPSIEELSKEEQLIAAAAAAIPADLLSRLMAAHGPISRGAKAGKAGKTHRSKLRGRRVGSERGDLNTGARIDLLATLRAAAPWQVLRRREAGSPNAKSGRLEIRREDIRVMRFKVPAETATIFVVDASGSSALHRLGEAKGAVELMLTDCYARRDSVALISFRGTAADTLLTPTRSLARAKRNLAALPGGGGTPLASAIDAASSMADSVRRRGQSAIVVFLTDGRANVARDGSGSRSKGSEEARAAAQSFRAARLDALLIDTSPHPKPEAAEIAQAMGARYLPLPHGDATAISIAVRRNVSI
jgi:magnesium chelatase subunit D